MDNRKKGILCLVGATFFLAMMSAFVRMAGELPVMQKLLLRSMIMVVVSYAELKGSGVRCRLEKQYALPVILRGVLGTLAIACNFYAVDHMNLADANMLNKLSPFFTVLFSWLLLKEELRPGSILALFAAFAGALLIVKPGGSGFELLPALAGVLGGGLGGGSSNAATVLMVLNHLCACGLTQQQLIDLGVKLGADVPFFIFGKTAFAEGIGEKLTALPIDLPHFVIIHPAVSVSTKEIFSHFVLTSLHNPIRIDRLTESIPLINDLQNIAVTRYPEIAHALAVLQQYGEKAMMTGSGSCVFLQIENGKQAQQIVAHIQATHPEYSIWAAKGLPYHPLANLLP